MRKTGGLLNQTDPVQFLCKPGYSILNFLYSFGRRSAFPRGIMAELVPIDARDSLKVSKIELAVDVL